MRHGQDPIRNHGACRIRRPAGKSIAVQYRGFCNLDAGPVPGIHHTRRGRCPFRERTLILISYRVRGAPVVDFERIHASGILGSGTQPVFRMLCIKHILLAKSSAPSGLSVIFLLIDANSRTDSGSLGLTMCPPGVGTVCSLQMYFMVPQSHVLGKFGVLRGVCVADNGVCPGRQGGRPTA